METHSGGSEANLLSTQSALKSQDRKGCGKALGNLVIIKTGFIEHG
jgi:hypothetical protein